MSSQIPTRGAQAHRRQGDAGSHQADGPDPALPQAVGDGPQEDDAHGDADHA